MLHSPPSFVLRAFFCNLPIERDNFLSPAKNNHKRVEKENYHRCCFDYQIKVNGDIFLENKPPQKTLIQIPSQTCSKTLIKTLTKMSRIQTCLCYFHHVRLYMSVCVRGNQNANCISCVTHIVTDCRTKSSTRWLCYKANLISWFAPRDASMLLAMVEGIILALQVNKLRVRLQLQIHCTGDHL